VGVSGLRLDLHNHTALSPDGLLSPRELLVEAAARGISCIAITDHNTVDGALQAAALAGSDPSLPRVIPGIELSTEAGEVIGLYITEKIPAHLPITEAIKRIRAQGGLVYLPHPYDWPRRGAVDPRQRERVAAQSDIIEVVNGRSLGPWCSRKAYRLARRLDKPQGAGSDAHRAAEVGLVYVLVDALPTRETLVPLLEQGTVEHELNPKEYTLNWGFQGLSPLTRARRRLIGTRSSHSAGL
jgi:predicted metal-dependent phosphoesterase TrpH